jgi:DnaJ-class molecular chaperone
MAGKHECPKCKGNKEYIPNCPICGGAGWYESVEGDSQNIKRPCQFCNGTGKDASRAEKCNWCNGTGEV